MSTAFESSAPLRRRAHLVVRSIHRIAIVPLSSIVRLDADDNYVRITADQEYRRKGTLAALIANLGPGPFLRVHRSHAVNLHAVRELKSLGHGEFAIALADGTRLRSSRSYHRAIVDALCGDLAAAARTAALADEPMPASRSARQIGADDRRVRSA
jgi:two-component system LytT family response regulator